MTTTQGPLAYPDGAQANGSLVALLIIKAHSQRVPEKNFRDLGGRPLFRWILDTLLSIDEIDRVVIDTDAQRELVAAGLIASPRLCLHERRESLRGDHVTANTLIADVIPGIEATRFLMTHVTNPFLGAGTIRRAISVFDGALAADTADALVSVTTHHARFFRADGSPLNHDPDRLVPTQDLAPLHEENSSLYLFTPDGFARSGRRTGLRPMLFATPRHESIDIDEPDDWTLAERVAAGIVTASG